MSFLHKWHHQWCSEFPQYKLDFCQILPKPQMSSVLPTLQFPIHCPDPIAPQLTTSRTQNEPLQNQHSIPNQKAFFKLFLEFSFFFFLPSRSDLHHHHRGGLRLQTSQNPRGRSRKRCKPKSKKASKKLSLRQITKSLFLPFCSFFLRPHRLLLPI